MFDLLAILLIISLIVWIVAQFVPSGRLGQIALGLWLVCATVLLCGGRITA